jgi:hypothetical protein
MRKPEAPNPNEGVEPVLFSHNAGSKRNLLLNSGSKRDLTLQLSASQQEEQKQLLSQRLSPKKTFKNEVNLGRIDMNAVVQGNLNIKQSILS